MPALPWGLARFYPTPFHANQGGGFAPLADANARELF